MIDTNQITLEILILLILILANGFFAMSEMALVSARKTRLQQDARDGNRSAKAALQLGRDPTRFLSTVQIGITLIGILSGAFGGATIAGQISSAMESSPALQPYSQLIGVGVVVVAITYFSLVLGELVPKRIALSQSERIAARVAPAMILVSRFANPIVRLLSASTEAVLRLLGVKSTTGSVVSEEEIRMLIFEGTRAGVFVEAERQIMERVFRLPDRKVSTVMTYRTNVIWLDIEDPLEANLSRVQESGYSHFPVCQGNIDHVLGIVRVRDMFAQLRKTAKIDLESLVGPALFLPEAMNALEVLERLKEARQHLALIVDEFGGVAGLVTLNDVLEAIVGEIPTADRDDEPEVVRRADGSLLLDGILSVEEVKDLLHLNQLPGEEEGEYETLGGLFMAQLGRIPRTGDTLDIENLRLEVVDMDGYRVDKVLVSMRPEE